MLGAGLLAGREIELNLILFPTVLPALARQLGLGWLLMGKYRVKIEGRKMKSIHFWVCYPS